MSDVLPNGWSISTLNDLSSVITKGTTPTTNGFPYAKSGVKFLRVENISKNGSILEDDLKFISQEANDSLRRSQLRSGDLLISIAGAIGRTALVEERHLPANTNQAVGIVRLSEDKAEKIYIRFSIESPIVDQQIKDMQSGLAQINLNLEQLGSVRINLPPLPEQKKIAAILTSVDEVIESTQAQINKLKDLKTGMMQELLTKGIGHTEFKDSVVGRIPKGWEVVAIGQLGNVITGSTPKTSEPELYGGTIPFISPADIGDHMFVRSSKSTLTIDGLSKTRSLPENSVLVVCIGSTIGKTGLTVRRCATNQQINAVVCKNNNPIFVYYLMTFFQKLIKGLAGTQAVPIINKTDFSNILIPRPPISEQSLIAESISSLDSKLFALENKKTNLVLTKKALMQDLLTGKVRVKGVE